jgi:hypothetical protein
MTKLEELIQKQAEFSDTAFGPPSVRNEMGALHHLEMEVKELIENTSDPMEWADCMLLLLDALRRKGYTVDQLIDFCLQKVEINKKRTWKDAGNGVFLHTK